MGKELQKLQLFSLPLQSGRCDAFDEVALREQEHHHRGDDRQGRPGHNVRHVGDVRALEVRQALGYDIVVLLLMITKGQMKLFQA